MDKIKVLHVVPYLKEGGVEKRRVFLAEGLDPKRFQQRVICLEASVRMKEKCEAAGIAVIELGELRRSALVSLGTIKAIRREILDWKPEVVHAAVFEGMYLGGMASILARGRGLVLEETSDLYGRGRSRAMRVLLRAISLFAHAYVAISPSVKEYLISEQKIPAQKVLLIQNAVPVPKRRSRRQNRATRERLGIPSDAFVVGSVGRLNNDHKRFTDVIDAFELASRLSPNSRLLIAGDGPDRARIERHARERGVADRVVFTGYVEDIDTLYGVMDVFVLASAHEGFGLVIAEAMMHGLPVIATKVGGVVSIVRDGETGVLVPVGDVRALASALGEVRVLPDIRKRIGTSAREYAQRELSLDRYIGDVTSLYEHVSSRNK
ncbi:MAG: glycosyltransferase [Candidatus Paceibacterota bacterium]